MALEFENTIVMFEISSHKFLKLQPLVQKWKSLNLGTKMPYLGIFRSYFQKIIVIFEVNPFEFILLQSFGQKLKSWNLASKIPYLGVLGSSFEQVLSYLKSGLSNLSYWKFGAKIKIVKCQTKNVWFEYFWFKI